MSLIETYSAANAHKRVCKSDMNADLVCLFFWMILIPMAVAASALGLAFLNTAT
jgi:hypothetical protein